MPKKALEVLTETMFYVLMAFSREPMCGIDVADYIERRTKGRVIIGPATLYTILQNSRRKIYPKRQFVGRKRTTV